LHVQSTPWTLDSLEAACQTRGRAYEADPIPNLIDLYLTTAARQSFEQAKVVGYFVGKLPADRWESAREVYRRWCRITGKPFLAVLPFPNRRRYVEWSAPWDVDRSLLQEIPDSLHVFRDQGFSVPDHVTGRDIVTILLDAKPDPSWVAGWWEPMT
jgi:hypothetical protein